MQCSKGEITVCPAYTSVYSPHHLTCEYSLLFQTVSYHQLCKRKLLLHYQVPTMRRHGNLWIYHFPFQQPVTFYCPEFKDSSSASRYLQAQVCFTAPRPAVFPPTTFKCSLSYKEHHGRSFTLRNCTHLVHFRLWPTTNYSNLKK
jgi:hypothetical protein